MSQRWPRGYVAQSCVLLFEHFWFLYVWILLNLEEATPKDDIAEDRPRGHEGIGRRPEQFHAGGRRPAGRSRTVDGERSPGTPAASPPTILSRIPPGIRTLYWAVKAMSGGCERRLRLTVPSLPLGTEGFTLRPEFNCMI